MRDLAPVSAGGGHKNTSRTHALSIPAAASKPPS